MRKTDKKIENRIIKALTQACESSLDKVDGFVWLSHECNFKRFPQSLIVPCYFINQEKRDDPASQKILTHNILNNLKTQEIIISQNQIQFLVDPKSITNHKISRVL